MQDFYLVIELWEVGSTECYNGNEQQQQANMKTPLKIAHRHLVQTTWHAIPSLHPTKQDGGSLIIYATPLIANKRYALIDCQNIWCRKSLSLPCWQSSGGIHGAQALAQHWRAHLLVTPHITRSCFVLALLLRRPLFAQIFRLTGPPKTIPTLSQS